MLPRKLTCDDVKDIFEAFFDGATIKGLAEDYGVSRGAIRNVLYRKTYKSCEQIEEMFPATPAFLELVAQQAHENRRKSKGRGITG